MANADYITHLEATLRDVDGNIERAKLMLEGPGIPDKMQALADLTHLRARHDELVQRIKDAKAEGATDWSALHMSFQEEADALVDTLDRWLTRLD
jgi:hypothetical protein